MILRIDCRETNIISLIENKENIIIEKLELGDIIIENEEKIIIIERKTFSDLINSILDGRYKEQKKRLFDFQEQSEKQCIISYLIEQNVYPLKYKKQLHGALINLAFLYNVKMVFSKDTQESLEYIYCILNKQETSYCKTSLSSLKNFTKNSGYSNFVKMINCIDGISLNTCIALEKSGIDTLSKLINILINEPDSLKNIKISEKRSFSQKLIDKLKNGIL